MSPATNFISSLRMMVLAGVSVVAISGCAMNSTLSSDHADQPRAATQQSLGVLAARYKANPGDKSTAINYAAALRAADQSGQAVAVLEMAIGHYPNDKTISVAYAKALAAEGRFQQALTVIDQSIRPDAPDWNALSVKGAILDQMGRNAQAREIYVQALTISPGEASVEANFGLSFAMTNDLASAEKHLRRAVTMRGANSRIRQNLALILGLQGKFAECKAIYAAELPPDQVAANMAYVRALLTQQNRWDAVAKG